MEEKIGQTAGKIWKTLKKNDQVSIPQLPKMLKEKDTLTYQALGWLAREGKISYQSKGKRVFVSLIKPDK
ncbi:MAG: hypothetical protein GXO93_03255 [FCB group bacterium]|nr:hypothetical protein [FCB group bacterium]